MIKVLTEYPKNKKGMIKDFESFFRVNITVRDLTKDDWDIIKQIDKAVFYERNLIKTPFGITDIDNISTGCKTVLSYLYLARNGKKGRIFDLIECGANAIAILFKWAIKLKDEETIFVLRSYSGLAKLEGIPANVNGVDYESLTMGV